MSEQKSNLKEHRVLQQRVIVSVIAVPIVAALVWFGTPWFTILGIVWGMGAALEFFGLVRRSKGLSPLTWFGLLWIMLFLISPHFDRDIHLSNVTPTSLLLTGTVVIPLIILLVRKGKENAFANWAWTVAGVLYIGWLLSNMIALRNLDDGRGWVFVAILGTFASDSCAYLAGRSLGKHKMAPYISPKKSWEGAAAGIAGAIIATTILAYLFKLPISYWQVIILGLLISIMGQLGDLVKSLFKRNMEVKDSGKVLPGHGGFLDRMDSLAFAGVTVYYFVSLVLP
jgi:phosphatidate cytidylyltransferase